MGRLTAYLPLVAMAGILAVCGWLVAGEGGMLVTVIGVLALILILPRLPPELAMRLGHAIPIAPWQAPEIRAMLEQLSRQAAIEAVPALYRVFSPALLVYSSGDRRASAIAITDGAMSLLTRREVRAVLAHEVAHIAANDIRLMRAAEILGRITSFIATFGLVSAIFGMLVLPAGVISVGVIWFLALAPTSMTLLQLALSRRREFAADAEAARLTGDPVALARALQKIDRVSRWSLARMFGDLSGIEVPSFLRTHPAVRDRISRLLSGA